MKLYFNFTEEQYIDFNMHYYKTSKVIQKSILKSRILGPVLFMVIPFVMPKPSGLAAYIQFIVPAIISVLWFFFIPKYSKSRYSKAVKKMLRERDNSIFGKKELLLSDENILIKGEFQETKTDFSSIIDIQESDKAIYLFIAAASAIIIPNEAFESQAQKQEFLDKIYSKVTIKKQTENKKSIFDKMDI